MKQAHMILGDDIFNKPGQKELMRLYLLVGQWY